MLSLFCFVVGSWKFSHGASCDKRMCEDEFASTYHVYLHAAMKSKEAGQHKLSFQGLAVQNNSSIIDFHSLKIILIFVDVIGVVCDKRGKLY